ncbi:MAG: peptidoglycan-binding protein, partial [Clostridia bacterium]|nr:peptidoglycan-binding protein [Clostridia bacterium]
TENAVKTAQATYGLPQTGIADNAFQQRLYSENQ